MRTSSSCFIGIALPEKYQKAFEELLLEIRSLDSNIETVQPKTPHITLYYLNKQSQYSIDTIANLIKPQLHMLTGASLTVGGFDYFTEDDPKVLFLPVLYPSSLSAFHTALSDTLHAYGDMDNAHAFHPHMTVGRLVNSAAKENFIKTKQKFKTRLDKITWDFTCEEVTIYGVDSTQIPQHQEKLMVVPIR